MITVDSEWKDVSELVLKAMLKLKANDALLFENKANERSISHCLAMYLREGFKDWDVDCEYNRIEVDPSAYKYLFLESGDPSTVSVFDTDGSRVFPDIVIHHRGKNGREDNLLVMEVKLQWSHENNSRDVRKLRAFTEQHEVPQIVTYQFGLFVEFARDGSIGEMQHFVRPPKGEENS